VIAIAAAKCRLSANANFWVRLRKLGGALLDPINQGYQSEYESGNPPGDAEMAEQQNKITISGPNDDGITSSNSGQRRGELLSIPMPRTLDQYAPRNRFLR
jgi:hypothetical protein